MNNLIMKKNFRVRNGDVNVLFSLEWGEYERRKKTMKKEELKLTAEWDKTFPKSDKVPCLPKQNM